MKIQTYEDITIEVLRSTQQPAKLVHMAARQTQVMCPAEGAEDPAKLIEFLVNSGHHSPLEHAHITLHLRGCSRSLLAQITRQRTFKFTSSSQHFQDSKDYPCVVHQDLIGSQKHLMEIYDTAFTAAYKAYIDLMHEGVPKEEARQVLPNAAAVNLIVTADARNMMYFLIQRRCQRNVEEMQIVADGFSKICKAWFPELFKLVGPDCIMTGKCHQGSLIAPECMGV